MRNRDVTALFGLLALLGCNPLDSGPLGAGGPFGGYPEGGGLQSACMTADGSRCKETYVAAIFSDRSIDCADEEVPLDACPVEGAFTCCDMETPILSFRYYTYVADAGIFCTDDTSCLPPEN